MELLSCSIRILCLDVFAYQFFRYGGICDASISVLKALGQTTMFGLKSDHIRQRHDMVISFGRQCDVGIGICIEAGVV